jgi:hypothetical protein
LTTLDLLLEPKKGLLESINKLKYNVG